MEVNLTGVKQSKGVWLVKVCLPENEQFKGGHGKIQALVALAGDQHLVRRDSAD